MISLKSKKYKEALKNEINDPSKSVELQRKEWEESVAKFKKPIDILIKEKKIKGINCEFLSLKDSETNKVILLFHGGGFISGSTNTHRDLACKLVKATGCTVITFDYSLAPENRYPVARDQSVELYKWLIKHYSKPETVTIIGDSAGGGLALSTLVKLRDDGVELPESTVLISAWADLTLSSKSYVDCKDLDPMVTKESLVSCAEHYSHDLDRRDFGLSPVFADFSGLPRMLIDVGSDEILLDDSINIEKRAREFGIDCKLRVFDGMWHVWHAFPIPEAEEAIIGIADFISNRQ